jgi:hypothetical protein
MPPTTRAAAKARIADAAAALPHELLARICAALPPGDAALTAPRVSKALAAAAAPRVAGQRAEVTGAREARKVFFDFEEGRRPPGMELFSAPLWALQEAGAAGAAARIRCRARRFPR